MFSAHFFQLEEMTSEKKLKCPSPRQLPLLALSSDQSTRTSKEKRKYTKTKKGRKKEKKASDSLLMGVCNSNWRQRFQIKLSSHFIVLCKQEASTMELLIYRVLSV